METFPHEASCLRIMFYTAEQKLEGQAREKFPMNLNTLGTDASNHHSAKDNYIGRAISTMTIMDFV